MLDTSASAIREFIEAIRVYSGCADWAMFLTSGETVVVQTRAESSAILLPATGRAVRCLGGTKVEVRTITVRLSGEVTLAQVLLEAVPHSASPPRSDSSVCQAERLALNNAFVRLGSTLFRDGNLGLLLADGFGYKTYDLVELQEQMAQGPSDSHRLPEMFVLSKLLHAAAIDLGTENIPLGSFNKWNELADRAIGKLEDLEARAGHAYLAYAYLNGPPCDFDTEEALCDPRAVGVSCFIGPATDSDLARAVEGYGYAAALPTGLQNCNTLLRIPLRIGVLGTRSEYEGLYPFAEEVASRVVDTLRMVYPGDIGISALLIESDSFGAPGIRQTYHTRYNPAYTAYGPHRGVYPESPQRPLSAAEVDEIRSLLARHMNEPDVRGYEVALRRFRDSYDRHWPTSPERLLDIAIALEALFLNDGEDKELRFRLSLRVARLLEPPGAARVTLFKAVRQLYDLRSKVAHGADLQSGSERDQRQLADTMRAGPELIRRAMYVMLSDKAPRGLKDDQLKEYWSSVELG